MKNVAAGNGKIYMGFGYINMTCYDSQCVVWFNKDIAQTYQLGDVYQMIENDEWTMDNFITMCRAFGANGENLYGVGAYPYVGAPALIYGCGTSFFEYNDATSHYEYVGLTEKMMDVYNKMGAMLLDHNVGNLDWQTYRSSFRDGETFAMCSNVSGMKEFRNVELNYGLAPFPKYDAEQKEYLSYTTNQIQGVCVNVISPDLGLIGTVLENLAAESYRQLRSAYFEQLVNERLLRDDESKEILAMIYDSPLVLPIEAVYDFKMPGNVFNFDGGNANMASRLDAARQMINIALDEFYSWTNG